MKAMDPNGDWSWLGRVESRVRARKGPVRNKRERTRHSGDLLKLGLSLMEEADTLSTPLRQAVRYRDGLMIALLAARPVRRKNFCAMVLGRNLVKRGADWWLAFDNEEMKTGQPLEAPLPKALEPHMETYLSQHRPVLLAKASGPVESVWASRRGTPMKEISVYFRFIKLTEAAFGKSVTLHLFRDCAATSLAMDDPEHVRMIAAILGHATLATAEKHYNQARSLEAGQLYQQEICRLRKSGQRHSRRST